MLNDWFSLWYTPEPDETIAYISMERIAEIGGALHADYTVQHINQGNNRLAQWCRVNCKLPGKPVNIKGKTAWAFKHADDAILFKLTWGGK